MASLEHVGIAAENVRAVLDDIQRLLGLRPYKRETVESQRVRTHFLDAGGTKLEVLEALDPDSPIYSFLERQGEGVHHLAFEVDALPETLQRLRDEGFTVLQDEPQPGADDKHIAFVHPKDTHGVLVEFCETQPPTGSPRRVDRGDRSLAVYERGDRSRPSLLLLHGAAGSTRLETAPLMRRLEADYHLIGLDLSGHGGSGLPADRRLTMDRLVADVVAVLDAVDAASAHLFGFSLGAAVALRTAHRHPERTDRLALLAPNTRWSADQVATLQAHLTPSAIRERAPERAARLAEAHHDLAALLSALRTFVAPLPSNSRRLHATLSEIAAPTLVAGLDADPMAPIDALRAIHRALPEARLAVLPGRQHQLHAAPLDLLGPLVGRHLAADPESGPPHDSSR